MSISSESTLRSVFIVWNNPEWDYTYEHDKEGNVVYDDDMRPVVIKKSATILNGLEPKAICERVVNIWCDSKSGRTGACTYCISAMGLHHLHIVLECDRNDKFRYSAVQKLYQERFHLEPTRGNKDQVYDYVHKQGKFEEKGELVVASYQHGEIIGRQGNRSDLDAISEMIQQGMTPSQILSQNFRNYKYETMIRKAFFAKRAAETPFKRNVKVVWHYGETGTAKTYWAKTYVDEHGEDDLFMLGDYEAGLDTYCGQKILFLDEFRGDWKMGYLLQALDGYKQQMHARYANVIPCWSEVHITSPFLPGELYKKMVNADDFGVDKLNQLMRRITTIVHHTKDSNGNYHTFEVDGCKLMGLVDQRQAIEDYEKLVNAKN